MEDKEKKLDELYRTKLNEFKLPVSDKVFANIKKELQLENKKTGFGFGIWILLFVCIAGAAIGGYFIISPINKNKPAATIISKNGSATSVAASPVTLKKE